MDDLISLSETISQASTLLADGVPGEDNAGPSTFLQVIVLGTLGAGKSAVLNTLIGHPVLPTAEGGATRFPLIVDIERNKHIDGDGVRGRMGSHTNMQSAAEIRKAAQADMKRWLPTSSRNKEERLLTVQSANAPPLRLVDLPGLESRASDNDDAVLDHAGGNAILLVVLPADAAKDASSTRVLRMVQNLDQEGTRTVGVITKLDLVADDKEAVSAVIQLLTGQGPSTTQDFPWVAVIGQPPNDKASSDRVRDSLEEAWKAETATLGSILRANGARGLESSLGREGLLRTLSKQIRRRMKERIPRIMDGLEARSQEVEDELLKLGDSVLATVEGSRAVALELCRGFDLKFVDNIEGGEGGGAKMVERFVGALPGRFRALPLDNLFSMENVKKVTMEADGYQPYLMSPEKGLRLLVKRCLDMAKQPGLQCVDEVHKILMDVVAAASNSAPSLIRFPPLKREMVAIASSTLEDYRIEARTMVNSLVDMERVFIPPGHFIDAAARRYEKMKQQEEAARKRELEKNSAIKRTSSDAITTDEKQSRMAQAMSSFQRKKDTPAPLPPSAPAAPLQELAGFLWKVSSKNGWSKRWFALSDKTSRLYYVKKPDEKTPRGVIPLEECIVDENVPPEEFPAISGTSDPLRGSSGGQSQAAAQALVFKISNKVPYKTVVKVHHSLILRAENMAEKTQWVARIRALTKAEKEKESATPPPELETAPKEKEAALQPAGAGAAKATDAPPVPEKPFRRHVDPEEELKNMALEVRYYVEAVLGHLSANIPKAIVLTQVERTKESMLTKLYTSISKLPNDRIAELLSEDPESKGRREKAQKQQAALGSLKRMLSLHEARATAEEANAAPSVKESPLVEDWRLAFQQAGGGRPSNDDDDDEPPPPPPRSSRRSSAESQQANGPNPPAGSGAERDRRGPSPQPARPVREAPAPPSNPASNGNVPRQSSPMRQPSPNRGPPPPVDSAPPTQSMGVPMGAPMRNRPTRLPPPPPGAGSYRF